MEWMTGAAFGEIGNFQSCTLAANLDIESPWLWILENFLREEEANWGKMNMFLQKNDEDFRKIKKQLASFTENESKNKLELEGEISEMQ